MTSRDVRPAAAGGACLGSQVPDLLLGPRQPLTLASCTAGWSKRYDPLLRHEVEGVHRLGSLGCQTGPWSEPQRTSRADGDAPRSRYLVTTRQVVSPKSRCGVKRIQLSTRVGIRSVRSVPIPLYIGKHGFLRTNVPATGLYTYIVDCTAVVGALLLIHFRCEHSVYFSAPSFHQNPCRYPCRRPCRRPPCDPRHPLPP